ncbi:hypothetical protein BRE01_31230 [Brevibacillus reuszeri]|uniref:Uncharacterized protein n=1 Tax=Brevibacillus reuszeri TaxID=54915 RepID=A0A0K9YYF5_9BACL|nr:hypothetical protein [Brevibacillus reuszeri]KNB73743.1 hypothetical protein ADS79_07335 [Brevibacillus reuszeri]MED1858445.1 hypothetical protein [Brevibacillus reuszeri]GED69421.1 hypothetical protein BRE01_31230 [Brevibacillus reuszeri]
MNRRIVLAPLFNKIGLRIISFSAIIAAVTYYIGFIFVQGSVMAFTQLSNIWNIGFEYVPASSSLYLINGITYLHNKLYESILGGIFTLIFYVLLYYPRRQNNSFWGTIDAYRSKKYLNYGFKLFFIVAPMLCIYLYGLYNNPSFIKYIGSFGVASFLISILIINNEYGKNRTRHFEKLIVSLFLIISLVTNLLALTVHVFIQGSLAQKDRIDATFNHGTSKGSISVVYNQKNNVEYYISIDLANDYFIGYNLDTKSIDKIPKDRISKIETFAVTKFKEVKKYFPDDHTQQITNDAKAQTALVNNFYEYGVLGKKDTEKWLSLLTAECYQLKMGLISPVLLKKEWAVLENYNGLPKNEYIGMEMSVPEEDTIWVQEHWKSQVRYTVFKLKKVGDAWKIDEVNEKWQPFIFVKG